MSDYGCCVLSTCNFYDKDGYAYTGTDMSCEECPYYDPNFFLEEAEKREVKDDSH